MPYQRPRACRPRAQVPRRQPQASRSASLRTTPAKLCGQRWLRCNPLYAAGQHIPMRQSDKLLAETPAAPRALLLPEAEDQTPAKQRQDSQPASHGARQPTPAAVLQSRLGSPLDLPPATLEPASLQPPASLVVGADAPGCTVHDSLPRPPAHTGICTDLSGSPPSSQQMADNGRLEREPCQDAHIVTVQPQSQQTAPHAAAAGPRQRDTSCDQHEDEPNAAAEQAQHSGQLPSTGEALAGARHPWKVGVD